MHTEKITMVGKVSNNMRKDRNQGTSQRKINSSCNDDRNYMMNVSEYLTDKKRSRIA